MSEVHYQWAPGEDYPDIQQHSIAKHEILRAYLSAYIQTLISSPRQEEFKLALIDGFAGGGAYRHAATGKIVVGSPFIMLEAAKEAEFLVNQNRQKPVNLDLDFFFIEKDKGAATLLQNEMNNRGYGHRFGNDIHLRNADFDSQADAIIEHVRKRSPRASRAIFLLDQYGYSQVPTTLIRKLIRQLPGSEVILTFAVDALLNYVSDDGAVTQNLLNKIGTPDVLRDRKIEDIKQKESDWRLFIQSCLYKDLVENCGAKYYTLFFIRSAKGHGDYWLIHFSQKARARDVMTRIHWEKNTNFIHYGGAGMDMFTALGYVPKHDEDFTGQKGFCFDEDAKQLSIEALASQIPHLVYPDPDGVTFGEMFATTCNLSPASADVYRDALGFLMDRHEVEIVGADGSQRKAPGRIRDTDHIIAPRQKSLFV